MIYDATAMAGRSTWSFALLALPVAFLVALGGFLYYELTKTGAADRYGSVSMPGRAVLELPAGNVDVSYAVDSENYTISVPTDPPFTVVSVSSHDSVHVDHQDGGLSNLNGVSYALVGTLQVPAAGRYLIQEPDAMPGWPNPRLEFGIASQHSGVLIISLLIAGVLLLLSVALIVLSRSREPGWR